MIRMARRARVIRFPKSPAPAPEPAPGFVEVRRCRDQAEALVVRSLLESEGIRVVLRSKLAHSVHPFSVGDQWTKRRAGRGGPPRNTLSRNPLRALVRSHESEAFASGNAQKPRFRGGPPRPARRPRVN